jgi:hypothetical protein
MGQNSCGFFRLELVGSEERKRVLQGIEVGIESAVPSYRAASSAIPEFA